MRSKDDQKEQLLLHTALDLISRVGLSGLKISDLAKEAGLATGTIYIYFKDKEALIRSLYRHLALVSTVDLLENIPESDPIQVKIQKTAFNYLRLNLEHPEYNAFFEQYFRSPYFSETEEEAALNSELLQPILALVQQGQAEKVIKDVDSNLLVNFVCGVINEISKEAYYSRRLVSDAEWRIIFNLIWDGIKS